MELAYNNNRIEKMFTDVTKLIKKVGHQNAKQIKRRLDILESFKNIFELMGSGIDNPHLLKDNLYGCISWSITGNLRLILDLEFEKHQKYDLEIAKRERISIKGVVDYHGDKDEWIIS